MLKLVKSWTARHLWRANEIVRKFESSITSSQGGPNQLSLCGNKACRGMECWFYRQYCGIKQTVTFERLFEQNWNFLGISVFMRAFYHGVRQAEDICSSEVTILPNNR